MMTKAYVITEGETDREILETVLHPQSLASVEFIVGAGRYSAQSLARSVLAMEEIPVALVVDADTSVESSVQEQRGLLQNALHQASPGVEFLVCLAVPEIEILLVQDWDFIRDLANRSEFSEMETEFAELAPKKFLLEILQPESYSATLRRLLDDISDRPQTIAAIREYPLVKRLEKFLLSVTPQDIESTNQSTPQTAEVHPHHV
ncbi:MAG: hypothetical protein ACLFTI_11550 [Anaerolineales bacterium]